MIHFISAPISAGFLNIRFIHAETLYVTNNGEITRKQNYKGEEHCRFTDISKVSPQADSGTN